MDTDTLKVESTAPADIPGMISQARAAYQQTRIKECLALTKALLVIDPGNAAAVQLQTSIRADMQRDLSDARALIEESRNKPEAQKYRKAAEIILLKALYLDPDNEGAKTLLSSMRAVAEDPSTTVPALPPVVPAPKKKVESWVEAKFEPKFETRVEPKYEPPKVESWPEPKVESTRSMVPLPVPPGLHAPPAVAPPDAPEPRVEAIAPPPHVEVVVPETPAHVAPVEHHKPVVAAEPHVAAYMMQPELESRDSIPFTTGATRIDRPDHKSDKRSSLIVPMIVMAVVVVAVGLLLARQRFGNTENAVTTPEPPAPVAAASNTHTQSGSYPVSTSNQPSSGSTTAANSTQTTKTAALDAAPSLPASNAPAAAAPANAKSNVATPVATGSLAVSCAIGAEIYIGDKLVGSTPTTLKLPVGNQTVEYRHGDLKTVVTHLVKANETITALITFDMLLQLQARPWANVFVEGPTRASLGTTPLSDVRLPVGSVLTFENPNFPSKSRKVTVDDKTITVQMAQP